MSQNVGNYRKQYMEAIINHHYEEKEPKVQAVTKKRKFKELNLTKEKIPKLQKRKPRTVKPIVCDLCDYKPKRMAHLKRHMKIHNKFKHSKSVKACVEKAERVEHSLKVEVFKCPIENCNFVTSLRV